MDNQAEVREFLVTRRAKISPEQAGLPRYGTRRRVPGLRREEVAQLAGLSTDYYAKLEKGNLRSASDSVLEAVARALQLDDAEYAHLQDLARAARGGARPARRQGTDRPGGRARHPQRGVPRALGPARRAPAHGGTKVFHHPVVGDLTLDYNTLPLPADPGLSLTAYTAEPGSPTAEKLALLASWTATPAEEQPAARGDA